MHVGIIGLPQSGKSCFFSFLTGLDSFKSPRGVVKMEDSRLQKLFEFFPTSKITYAEVIVDDIAGIKEDSPGVWNTPVIKDAEVFVIVVRGFEDEAVVSSKISINPLADYETLVTTFILTDIEAAQKSVNKITAELAKGRKEREFEYKTLKKIIESLEKEIPLSKMEFLPQEETVIRGYKFLSQKPVVLVVNISEKSIANGNNEKIIQAAQKNKSEVIFSCLKAEYEISRLAQNEQALFMSELGIKEFSRKRILETCFRANKQIFFFTAGEKDIRAWPIREGTNAVLAAAEIHSDMQKGFIKAQVIAYEQFLKFGSFYKAKTAGALRLESKEYILQDGDIIEFKFST